MELDVAAVDDLLVVHAVDEDIFGVFGDPQLGHNASHRLSHNFIHRRSTKV